jgi:hypothetical protein
VDSCMMQQEQRLYIRQTVGTHLDGSDLAGVDDLLAGVTHAEASGRLRPHTGLILDFDTYHVNCLRGVVV